MMLSQTYRSLLQIPEGRVVILSAESPIEINNQTTAVLFVLAKWSMASQIAFRSLNSSLANNLGGCIDFRLIIADADNKYVEDFIFSNSGVPSGGGESYWIKDGRVVADLANYGDMDMASLEQNMRLITPVDPGSGVTP